MVVGTEYGVIESGSDNDEKRQNKLQTSKDGGWMEGCEGSMKVEVGIQTQCACGSRNALKSRRILHCVDGRDKFFGSFLVGLRSSVFQKDKAVSAFQITAVDWNRSKGAFRCSWRNNRPCENRRDLGCRVVSLEVAQKDGTHRGAAYDFSLSSSISGRFHLLLFGRRSALIHVGLWFLVRHLGKRIYSRRQKEVMVLVVIEGG
jgi:hypothetical protein